MSGTLSLLAQTMDYNASASAHGSALGGACFGIVELGIIVFVIAGMWKVFVKAGQPGWAAIIPIYNIWILLQIAGRPGWWIILFLIPLVNLIVGILVCIDIAARFGKSTLFGVGLALLGFIFFPILGFSDAVYQPGVAGGGFPVTPTTM